MKRGWRGLGRLVFASLVLSASLATAAELDRSVLSMGTRLDLHVEGAASALPAATEAAVREAERIEAACSTWRPSSDWSRLNEAHGQPVPLTAEWRTLLRTALDWQRRTQGAFDPVLGALIRAWGLREGGRTPDASELAHARAASGAQLLVIDDEAGTARLTDPRAAVEEGGFVKGYALDRMAAVLREKGVEKAVLNFGGQVLAFGAPTVVEVASPAHRFEPAAKVTVDGASLSTSGTSEHGRHILDPRTGERSPAWGSVTVLAADGLTADVLSTALYVLGPRDGLRWANANHVAALFQPLHSAARASGSFPKPPKRNHR